MSRKINQKSNELKYSVVYTDIDDKEKRIAERFRNKLSAIYFIKEYKKLYPERDLAIEKIK